MGQVDRQTGTYEYYRQLRSSYGLGRLWAIRLAARRYRALRAG